MTTDELRQMALRGSRPAQAALGVSLLQGTEGPTDLPEAFRWLRAASEAGVPRAMLHLGSMYRDGVHVDPDPHRARILFEQAAAAGEFLAAASLARMLANGEAGAVDSAGACRWYREALAQKDRVAADDELKEARAYLAQHAEPTQ